MDKSVKVPGLSSAKIPEQFRKPEVITAQKTRHSDTACTGSRRRYIRGLTQKQGRPANEVRSTLTIDLGNLSLQAELPMGLHRKVPAGQTISAGQMGELVGAGLLIGPEPLTLVVLDCARGIMAKVTKMKRFILQCGVQWALSIDRPLFNPTTDLGLIPLEHRQRLRDVRIS
ncbi:hypothetical protein M422DRAFT_41677 [Sphaerobolus stellatus SS14]|nr:hypothetical protein M422DRAFT_41677 [Sphaerobolus stellatus SS14]